MDLVTSCKGKLTNFRVKELKDVLTQLGLSKQGKKQDLMDRILSVLSDDPVSKMPSWTKKNSIGKEGMAKIIDDAYRKMQVHGTTDLASKGQSGSDINNVKFKEEPFDSLQLDVKVRCPCGSSLLTEMMIQCEDPQCHVHQHIGCVIIPEEPMEGVPPVPPQQFYCEICRLTRADPFWVAAAHPLLPVKLTASNLPTDGTNPVQNVEKKFQLTREDQDLLQKMEYDIQAWCVLLNDKVPFRMQWPQYADLQINGVAVRTTNRPGSQLLGANSRDEGPAITTCTREGINKISLTGIDARVFCFGVRIGRRRTVQEVLNIIPKEPDGERFEDALARVCRCIGGGNATENADSDSDLELVADSFTVNLRCPMSGSRMKIAGRFKPCAHMGCFDLETFVELNQRSRKWQCPICLKNYSLENIIIDPYFNRITSMMRDCGEDVNDIEVKPDGSWRVKNENERQDLSQWHFPDGSLCVAIDEVKYDLEASKKGKSEIVSEGNRPLKLGIKKNQNGIWEFSKPEELPTISSRNPLKDRFEIKFPKVMPMSSSDGDDPSVNRDGRGHFDNEVESISQDIDQDCEVANKISSAPLGNNPDVIILSDSEEETEKLMSPGTLYMSGQADPYLEDLGLGTGRSLFNGGDDDDDFRMPLWPLPSVTQASPGLKFFGTEADGSDSLVDLQRTSVTCPTSMHGYTFDPDTAMGSAAQIADSIHHSNTDLNGGLVDNPLAFGGDDPSLQIFLPSRPAGVSMQADTRDQPGMSNGVRTEDWMSLRLGGGESALNSKHQLASKDGPMETLANAVREVATIFPLLLFFRVQMMVGQIVQFPKDRDRIGVPANHDQLYHSCTAWTDSFVSTNCGGEMEPKDMSSESGRSQLKIILY